MGSFLAARYLQRRGLHILRRRWQLPQAELDLLALDGTELVCMRCSRWPTAAP